MPVEYKDYYKTLGVPKNAATDDIKKAYRKLARQYHPDVNKSPTAEKRIKEINEAHEVLSDPGKRKRYDTVGPDWERYAAGWGLGVPLRLQRPGRRVRRCRWRLLGLLPYVVRGRRQRWRRQLDRGPLRPAARADAPAGPTGRGLRGRGGGQPRRGVQGHRPHRGGRATRRRGYAPAEGDDPGWRARRPAHQARRSGRRGRGSRAGRRSLPARAGAAASVLRPRRRRPSRGAAGRAPRGAARRRGHRADPEGPGDAPHPPGDAERADDPARRPGHATRERRPRRSLRHRAGRAAHEAH